MLTCLLERKGGPVVQSASFIISKTKQTVKYNRSMTVTSWKLMSHLRLEKHNLKAPKPKLFYSDIITAKLVKKINTSGMFPSILIIIIIDNFCIALFSDVRKLTALYNTLQRFLSENKIIKGNNVHKSNTYIWTNSA